MAYHIRYGTVKTKRTVRPVLLTVLFLVLFLLASNLLFPQQLMALRELVFSHSAWDALSSHLQQSEGILDTVAAFCQDILNVNAD